MLAADSSIPSKPSSVRGALATDRMGRCLGIVIPGRPGEKLPGIVPVQSAGQSRKSWVRNSSNSQAPKSRQFPNPKLQIPNKFQEQQKSQTISCQLFRVFNFRFSSNFGVRIWNFLPPCGAVTTYQWRLNVIRLFDTNDFERNEP